MKQMWKTVATTGPMLQSVLQSLSDHEWEIVEIFEHGLQEQNVGKVVGAGQTIVTALFTVVARRWEEVKTDA